MGRDRTASSSQDCSFHTAFDIQKCFLIEGTGIYVEYRQVISVNFELHFV